MFNKSAKPFRSKNSTNHGARNSTDWIVKVEIECPVLAGCYVNFSTHTALRIYRCTMMLSFFGATCFTNFTHNIEWVEKCFWIFPECVARVPVSLGGLGVRLCSPSFAFAVATVRNRSQPFASVRNRLCVRRKALHSGEPVWSGPESVSS